MRSSPARALRSSLALALLVPPASFAAQRTFVASYGNDAANLAAGCTITQPCRSFGSALTKTSAGGEVIVLDSAGYGPVIIDKSVSIVAPPGVYAGITVSLGSGVTINTPAISVRLAGLTISGQGGASGILFANGDRLTVERCTIRNMPQRGIYVLGPRFASISDSRVEANGGSGIEAADGAQVVVERLTAVDHATSSGVAAVSSVDSAVTRVLVANSTFAHNYVGIYGAILGGTGYVRLAARGNSILGFTGSYGILSQCTTSCVVDQVVASATANTVTSSQWALSSDGGGATLVASGNDVNQNSIGLHSINGATFGTLQNNAAQRNVIDVLGTITPLPMR